MKSIVLQGIDESLAEALKIAAKEAHISINQYVQNSLHQDLGVIKKSCTIAIQHDLDDLFGRWAEDEFYAIERRLLEQRGIDVKLWQ